MSLSVHPCQICGACCAHFRVAFYWREAEIRERPNPVPIEMTEEQDEFHRNMKGTNEKHSRKCVALEGRIGKFVACTIYDSRPTPCRAFTASYEDGNHYPRCDEARAAHGLPPLRPGWVFP
ncbi:MAG: YkgJ family cysteine cluster protein [Xanthomonadaceae bacterium]|nr:YkgJ family cysteine cluster protein [Xanthomonadaceae bacterium]